MRKNKNSKKIVLLIVIIFLLLLIGGTGVYFMLNNKGNKPIKINYNDYIIVSMLLLLEKLNYILKKMMDIKKVEL